MRTWLRAGQVPVQMWQGWARSDALRNRLRFAAIRCEYERDTVVGPPAGTGRLSHWDGWERGYASSGGSSMREGTAGMGVPSLASYTPRGHRLDEWAL